MLCENFVQPKPILEPRAYHYPYRCTLGLLGLLAKLGDDGGGGNIPAPLGNGTPNELEGICPNLNEPARLPPSAAPPIVSEEDMILLVAERAERAEGDCERDDRPARGESRDERVMAGERERELYGVAGGEGYGELRGEKEGSDCDSHLWLRLF